MSSFRRLVAWCSVLLRKAGILAVPLAVLAIARPPVELHAGAMRTALVPLAVAALALTAMVALLGRDARAR